VDGFFLHAQTWDALELSQYSRGSSGETWLMLNASAFHAAPENIIRCDPPFANQFFAQRQGGLHCIPNCIPGKVFRAELGELGATPEIEHCGMTTPNNFSQLQKISFSN
jgi:hypothetical protein